MEVFLVVSSVVPLLDPCKFFPTPSVYFQFRDWPFVFYTWDLSSLLPHLKKEEYSHCIMLRFVRNDVKYGSRYSRMDQVKIVEDSLSKNWMDMVRLSGPYNFKFSKGCLPQISLDPFWTSWPIWTIHLQHSTCWPTTLLKRDSNTGVFLCILPDI